MPYAPQTWTNNDPATPLSGPRLTAMETGIDAAHTLVDDLIADEAALVTGDNVVMYGYTGDARLRTVKDGTAAAPVTTSGPTLKVSRTELLSRATVEAGGAVGTDGADQVAAIMGISKALAGSETQAIGVTAVATNVSAATPGAGGSLPDACALYSFGRVLSGGTGTGIGAFLYGRRDDDNAQACAVELHCGNYGTVDAAYAPTAFTPATGAWVNCSGNADSGGGIVIGNAFGRQFEVGLAFNAQVNNAKTGGVRVASIRDDSTSTTVFQVNGTHTYGIDFNGSTFSGGPIRLKNATSVIARNAAGTADLLLFQCSASNELRLDAFTRVATGLVFGNGINIALPTTTGTKLGTATTQLLGFWNAAPVVRPTGWGAPTGTATRTTFATTTVTHEELAQRVKGLVDDLTLMGLIGA